MPKEEILDWLLDGDVSVRYQSYRDLLGEIKPQLQARIEKEGWGKAVLQKQKPNGLWGSGFYQPKWTSTHYTLLDLRYLDISPACKPAREALGWIIRNCKDGSGAINTGGLTTRPDVCINAMALNYFSYFEWPEEDLESIVDFILSQAMPDGGFNCTSNRKGAVHSSLHTTLSVLEGFDEFLKALDFFRYSLQMYDSRMENVLPRPGSLSPRWPSCPMDGGQSGGRSGY